MVRVELKGYQEALGVFDQKPVKSAARSAIEKVGKSAVSTASTEIRRVYNVKKSDLDPRIKLRTSNLATEITISGEGMSLSFFGARQMAGNRVITRSKTKGGGAVLKSKTMKRSAQIEGVQVEVLKGRRTMMRSVFLAKMRSGHIGVMRRVAGKEIQSRAKYAHTKHAQAIAEKGVVSIAYMARNAKVAPAVLAKVQESWEKTFPQELNYQLNVKGKR